MKPQQGVGSLATKANPEFLLQASAPPRFGKGLVDWSEGSGAAPPHSGGGRALLRGRGSAEGSGGCRHLPHLKSRSRPWVWLVKRVKASMAPAHGHAAHRLRHESSGVARPRGKTRLGPPERPALLSPAPDLVRKSDLPGFRSGPEVVVTKATPSRKPGERNPGLGCAVQRPPACAWTAPRPGSPRGARRGPVSRVPRNPRWNPEWRSPELLFGDCRTPSFSRSVSPSP